VNILIEIAMGAIAGIESGYSTSGRLNLNSKVCVRVRKAILA